jgi:hypothetical protein
MYHSIGAKAQPTNCSLLRRPTVAPSAAAPWSLRWTSISAPWRRRRTRDVVCAGAPDDGIVQIGSDFVLVCRLFLSTWWMTSILHLVPKDGILPRQDALAPPPTAASHSCARRISQSCVRAARRCLRVDWKKRSFHEQNIRVVRRNVITVCRHDVHPTARGASARSDVRSY